MRAEEEEEEEEEEKAGVEGGHGVAGEEVVVVAGLGVRRERLAWTGGRQEADKARARVGL